MPNERLNDNDFFKLCVEYRLTKWKKVKKKLKKKK